MSIPVSVRIAYAEAQVAVKEAGDDLFDRLRAAMRKTYRHWMVTDEDLQFKTAIGAVLASASGEEQERLHAEMRALQNLSAMMDGIPVDIDRAFPDDPGQYVGLLKLWHGVKEERHV